MASCFIIFSLLKAVKKNHFQNFKSTKTKEIIFSAHFSPNVKVILIVKGNFPKDILVQQGRLIF